MNDEKEVETLLVRRADFLPKPLDKHIANVDIWSDTNATEDGFRVLLTASAGCDIVQIRSASGSLEIELGIKQASVDFKTTGCGFKYGPHYYENFENQSSRQKTIQSSTEETDRKGALNLGSNPSASGSANRKQTVHSSTESEGTTVEFEHRELSSVQFGNWRSGNLLEGVPVQGYAGWEAEHRNGPKPSGILAEFRVRKNWISIEEIKSPEDSRLGRAVHRVKSSLSNPEIEKSRLFSLLLRELIFRNLQNQNDSKMVTLAAAGLIAEPNGSVEAVVNHSELESLELPDHILLRMLNCAPGTHQATFDKLIIEIGASEKAKKSDFVPTVPYAAAHDAYLDLWAKYDDRNTILSKSETYDKYGEKVVQALKKIGLLAGNKEGLILLNHFPNADITRSFQAVVKRQPTIRIVDEFLLTYPDASARDIGEALNDKLGRDWKDSSLSRFGHQIRGWCRFDEDRGGRGSRPVIGAAQVSMIEKLAREGKSGKEIAGALRAAMGTLDRWRASPENTTITREGKWRPLN